MRVYDKKVPIVLVILGLLFSSISYLFQPFTPFYSIAHRGASAYAPENTMAAFHEALTLGFDYIELDIRLSKDQELVVIHDESVNRTTNGDGLVSEMTIKELKKLDAGSWFHSNFTGESIPLLSEVLDQFGGKIGIIIEMKSPNTTNLMTKKLSNLLSDSFNNGLDPQSIKVQTFHIDELRNFHKLNPSVSTGILTTRPLDFYQLSIYRNFASFISVHHQYLSKSFIHAASHLDYEVYSWTIKRQAQFIHMQRLQVHGVISDEIQQTSPPNLFAAYNLFEKGQQFLKLFI